jgi:hypothetical protein
VSGFRRTRILDRHGRDVTRDPFQGGFAYPCPFCDGEGTLTEHAREGVQTIATCRHCNGNGLVTTWP